MLPQGSDTRLSAHAYACVRRIQTLLFLILGPHETVVLDGGKLVNMECLKNTLIQSINVSWHRMRDFLLKSLDESGNSQEESITWYCTPAILSNEGGQSFICEISVALWNARLLPGLWFQILPCNVLFLIGNVA